MSAPAWPYPAPVDDGGACHLVSGLALPDMALASTQGTVVNLLHLTGRAVVYVYPWAGRPGRPNPAGWDEIRGAHGSTPQAAGFRDLHVEFEARDARVFGLSGQSEVDQTEERLDRRLLPGGEEAQSGTADGSGGGGIGSWGMGLLRAAGGGRTRAK